MTPALLVFLSHFGKLLQGELANRLEHGEARCSLVDEILLDEEGEALEDVELEVVTANRLRRVEVPPGGKDPESRKQPLLVLRQEAVTPVDRCAKRSLSCRCVARPLGE